MRGQVLCASCAAGEAEIREPGASAGYAVGVRRDGLWDDALILGGATLFLVASFLRSWYRTGGGVTFGIPVPSYSFNAWGGVTFFAGAAAAVAVAWVALRRLGVPEDGHGLVDLALAAAGLALTALGLVLDRPTGAGSAGSSWAFGAGLPLAVLWLAGAIRRFRRVRAESRLPAGSGFVRP